MADKTKFIWATGRRKSSTARVRMKPGTGEMIINGKKFDDYFARPVLKLIVNQPLEQVGMLEKFDVFANCTGGGHSGQAGALRHGISRALIEHDETLRASLKSGGFLTRDDRKKERKKYGLRGARCAYQFSKR
ncbi:MAG: 30S ribosomal protein S9 [Bdellovibrionota bacterium]